MFTFCLRCGRALKNKRSMQIGYGLVCAKKHFQEQEKTLDFSENNQFYDLPYDGTKILCRRDQSGKVHFNFYQQLVKHSPTGMEWGYGGSGPADFAINALLKIGVDKDIATCPVIYQNFNDFKLILYPVGQIDSLINSPWQQIAQKTKQKFIIFVLNELEKYGTTIYPKDFNFFDMINDFRGIQSFEFFIDEHKIGLKYNDKISIIVAETLF